MSRLLSAAEQGGNRQWETESVKAPSFSSLSVVRTYAVQEGEDYEHTVRMAPVVFPLEVHAFRED